MNGPDDIAPRPQPAPDPIEMRRHYSRVWSALREGQLVPFLGAGANLCGRPARIEWTADEQTFLPSGAELSTHLARKFEAPLPEVKDLVRVSQCVSLLDGPGPLFTELHDVFDRDYPPTDVHTLLADMPSYLRRTRAPLGHILVVTTNYDDLLERAFTNASEPFDVVTYIAHGDARGKFRHLDRSGKSTVIAEPNNYGELSLNDGSIILKLHGAVARGKLSDDSFVITEDHYIDYLSRTDLTNLLPVKLTNLLRWSHLLFLGYALKDWNLRVILHRIRGDENLRFKWWAVQHDASQLDHKFWASHQVDVLSLALEVYIKELRERLAESLGP